MSGWTNEAITEVFSAVEDVDHWFYRHATAETPLAAAEALIHLASAMADLRSWHPKYDPDSQVIVPWGDGRAPDNVARSKGLYAPGIGSTEAPR